MEHDEFLLSEFKKVLQKYGSDPVIDLDEKFPHRIDLFVQIHEILVRRLGGTIPPHKWSHSRIGLIKQGSADYACGIYKFKATKNTLVIIPPRVVNSSTNWTENTKGYFLLFNPDFFLQNHFPYKHLENKKILMSSIQPFLRLTDDQADQVESIFKIIFEEKQGNHSHKKELIAIKIIELLILSERLYSEVLDFSGNEITLEVVRKFTELVEMNFYKERSVTFYASRLHIHPNYLNALIKSHTGCTAKESIQNRLLLETKYLIRSTNLSIKEISTLLGFDDPNYFTVFFKRLENLSPIAYRTSFL
ncbi:MAG: helix-turn-helix domain-containing protein [Flavisolibacter sp.]